MTNCTITFFPTERPISPVPDPESPYTLNVTLTAQDRSDDVSRNTLTTKSGLTVSNKLFDRRMYACTTAPAGLPGEPTVAEMEMFRASTNNGEEFTITIIDESDRVATVKMSGNGATQNRRQSAADVAKFPYSFTVRETS